tara:strand:+ start:116 stop:250 length:135 start_codon:yes stop_codon:yes gene_type:complete
MVFEEFFGFVVVHGAIVFSVYEFDSAISGRQGHDFVIDVFDTRR